MSIFRKKALDALNTPEQLDQPMQLLRPGHWALLFGLLSFSGYIVIWSIFGRLPIRIQGSGVLTTPNTIHLIQAEIAGRIKSMPFDIGTCIKKGETLALIDPVELKLEQKKAEDELTQLINDDRGEETYARKRYELLERELKRVSKYARSGAISADDYDRREQKTRDLEAQIFAEDNRRNQRIKQQQLTLFKIKEKISQMAAVKAHQNGCIVGRQVQTGQYIQPATILFEFNVMESNDDLISLGFFAAKDGKRLKLGQPVRVTPTTTKQQRHGGIQGVITEISPLPISQAALKLRLGNQATVNSINPNNVPLIEVTTSLKISKNTLSGYDWGGGPGPDLSLTPGTNTNISVVVEQRPPISYVIPLLRDLSGIY